MRWPCRNSLEITGIFSYVIDVRLFKIPWFSRFASKEGIQENELKKIVDDVLETGQADANLGGDVYKVRIARSGEGKSSGYRIIVFFRCKERTFFHYIFAKSARGNISKSELKTMKRQAKELFSLSDEQLDVQLRKGTLIEIK